MTSVNLSIPLAMGRYTLPRPSLQNPYSTLPAYEKRLAAADARNFTEANASLINFIDQDKTLETILQGKAINENSDLKEVIISGAVQRLDKDSPITRKFLEEHFEFAQFVAANIGKIAEILNSDKELSKAVVKNGDLVSGGGGHNIVSRVTSLLGPASPVTREFLNNNIEVAIHLLENPTEMAKIKADLAEARRFVAETGRNSVSYNEEIVVKAKALLNRPDQFNTTFLQNNIEFAQAVVASDLNRESLTIAGFLQANPDLTVDEFSTSGLYRAYQAELAASRFPSDFPLRKEFFSGNEPLTVAVVGSKELVANLKAETSSLGIFFGPLRTPEKVNKEMAGTVAKVYRSSLNIQHTQLSPAIDMFA